MALAFTAGALFGMMIQAGAPRHAAAQATAAPWLPLDWVTMPLATSFSVRERMAFEAPRILKEPVFCRFSHLKKSCVPVRAFRDAEVKMGVRWILGEMRACAARIASQLGGWYMADSVDGAVLIWLTLGSERLADS